MTGFQSHSSQASSAIFLSRSQPMTRLSHSQLTINYSQLIVNWPTTPDRSFLLFSFQRKTELSLKLGISSGPEGIRTLDLYSAIVALSQLSYRPASEWNGSLPMVCCQDFNGRYTPLNFNQ